MPPVVLLSPSLLLPTQNVPVYHITSHPSLLDAKQFQSNAWAQFPTARKLYFVGAGLAIAVANAHAVVVTVASALRNKSPARSLSVEARLIPHQAPPR